MLDRIQKIALARVISDLIEADFIVEESEMNFFEKIISKDYFNISEAMLAAGKKMDWAQAVSLLKELGPRSRSEIFKVLKDLSLSDGECATLEAVQIFAIEQVLEFGAEVYSIPATETHIDNMKVIYIENEAATSINEAVKNNYEFIRAGFASIGFDFVYIPFVVNDFKNIGSDYLQKVIRYMMPSAAEKKILHICNELQNMTTAKFCRDLLYKKLNIPIIDAQPSLLIKIGESDLVNQYDTNDGERTRHANFLQIALSDDVLNCTNRIVSRYRSMVSKAIAIQNRVDGQKFVYYGFHRSLFDLIAYGHEQKDCKLVFDFSSPFVNVYFEAVDGSGETISLKLNPQEATLYYMIVKYSLFEDGLDWLDEPPTDKKKQILEEYNKIYYRIGKGKTVNEYKDRTQIHHIKTRLLALRGVANIDKFIPLHIRSRNESYYVVKASSWHIQVIE